MPERKRLTGRVRVLTFSWLVLVLSPVAIDRPVFQSTATATAAAAPAADAAQIPGAVLMPTAHPPLPAGSDEFWLVPATARAEANAALYKRLADGIEDLDSENYAAALAKVGDQRLQKTPFADYANYYIAVVHLHTGRAEQARVEFQRVRGRNGDGVLSEWALIGEAQGAEASGHFSDAASLYEQAVNRKANPLEDMLAGQARSLLGAGDREHALTVFRRLYYEFPLSPIADSARQQILSLTGRDEATRVKGDFDLELGRAQRLFGSKRYAEALSAFETLRPHADGDQRELIMLRIAEAQYYLGRYRVSLEGTKPFIDHASRKAEARFFYASSLRGTGDHANYIAETRKLIADFPDSSWAEDALNNLATHYILRDEDDSAMELFQEYLKRFPTGRYAQRASWKLGWVRYRQGEYQAAIAIFEQAAAHFPRSDFRPPYLYWTGRAYDHLDQADRANARYALVTIDYLNSYYGRLAEAQLKRRGIGSEQRPGMAANPTLSSVTMPAATQAESTNVSAGMSSPSGTGGASEPDAPGTSAASENGAAKASAVSVAAAAAGGDPAQGQAQPQAQSQVQAQAQSQAPAPAPAAARSMNADAVYARIRQLIGAGLYAPAAAEIAYAERVDGPSPRLEATLAWLYKAQGEYRKGIVAMKRAYPQYLTANGQQMPKEAQKVIFPIDYWVAIRKAATARGLDPYLIAALINQESAFEAGVRSAANAYGLMQVVPQTGKQLARKLKIRKFSTARLTDPAINLQLGTLYFKNLLDSLGNVTYVLASYNAGESKVVRWVSERRALQQDEFIDDIPYPETQNYVKKILSTAEDYRRLYGS
jgi:soluble lytic murein transglycosylase-like protein/TolA-binding protein